VSRLLVPLLLGCLFVAGLSGCGPSTVSTTTTNQVKVIIEQTREGNDDVTDDIVVENVTLGVGRLNIRYHDPFKTPTITANKTNDPCYLISGTIKNAADDHYCVSYFAVGYDNQGNIVSMTLVGGWLFGTVGGIEQVDLDPHSSKKFTLCLSWSDNVSYFMLRSATSPQGFLNFAPVPLPAGL